MVDLFLSNLLSGTRTASLVRDAKAARTVYVDDLAKNLGSDSNSCRNLRKKLLRRNKWPKLYYGSVRVLNKRAGVEETIQLPMLLPHELIGSLIKAGDKKHQTPNQTTNHIKIKPFRLEYQLH